MFIITLSSYSTCAVRSKNLKKFFCC